MKNLAEVLKEWRYAKRIGVRNAAKIMGLDHATLSRAENGKMPSAETLRTILIWLLR